MSRGTPLPHGQIPQNELIIQLLAQIEAARELIQPKTQGVSGNNSRRTAQK